MGLFKRKKRDSMGIGLHDRLATPRRTEDQDAPEQERPARPDEEADMAVHQLKNPPQAEGQR